MSELEQAKADLEKARVELDRQLAAYLKILPQPKKKPGRPLFWIGYQGFSFVREVELILKRRRCTIAKAIETAVKKLDNEKHPMAARFKKDNRDLQIRFQEARNFWQDTLHGPIVGGGLGDIGKGWQSRRDIRRAAYESALRAFEIALERHRKALRSDFP
jgi:hypothetical protein